MNAEFLHLETLSWKLCGFNFSNCIVRDSCCPPNMRAWKIVFQLCFIILKKFLTFKKHCCFIYRQQKEAFYEFAFNFYSSIDWGLLTNKYYAQLGKIKNMCSTLKGPAVKGKEKVHLQLKTIGQWFTYFVQLNGCVHATGARHGADHLIIPIIVMTHRWEGSSYTMALVLRPLYHVMMVLVCCVVRPLSVSLKTLLFCFSENLMEVLCPGCWHT